MKKEIIVQLHGNFEKSVHKDTDNGTEFWLARDLQKLLGYSKWENFAKVIKKAKTACKTAGYEVADHFLDIRKMVALGSGAVRELANLLKKECEFFATYQIPRSYCRTAFDYTIRGILYTDTGFEQLT
jgi:hypothetical protein